MTASYNVILFYLDGTLVDTSIGIYHSYQAALSEFDCSISREVLVSHIGPPAPEVFKTLFPHLFSNQINLKKVLHLQRAYYRHKGITESEPYPGIMNVLQALKKAGKTLCVATSKPTVFAKKIVDHQNMSSYFDVIVGSTLNLSRTKKADVIAQVLKKFLFMPRKNIVMIGDRRHDIDGAVENHIDTIGVTYGFGSENEIRNAKPTHIAHNSAELLAKLL